MPRFSRWIRSTVLRRETVEADDLFALVTDSPIGAAVSYADLSAQLASEAGSVVSVNGQTGAVVLELGVVDSVVAGSNVAVDDTDPRNPIVSASGGGGGGAVDSVNGETGDVVLTAADVGAATTAQGALADTAVQPAALTAETNARIAADALLIPLTQKGANAGVATLDGGGKVPTTQLPALAITDTFVVASQAAMLALTAQVGDVAVRTDLNQTFILRVEPATTLGNWQQLLTPTDVVQSVDGRTGTVSLADLYDAAGDAAAVEALLNAHVADTTDAHDASAISFASTPTMPVNNLQTGLAAVGDALVAQTQALQDHIDDPTAAHAASAVSMSTAGFTQITGADVQAGMASADTVLANHGTRLDDVETVAGTAVQPGALAPVAFTGDYGELIISPVVTPIVAVDDVDWPPAAPVAGTLYLHLDN